MPIALLNRGPSWLALAALLGALSVMGGPSSACTEMADDVGCVRVCGCCRDTSLSAPETRGVPGPMMVRPARTTPGLGTCPAATTGGCVCDARAPAAPGPKGDQAGTGRLDPGHVVADGGRDLGFARGPSPAPVLPASPPPPRTPLYLRISRLLT